MNIIKEYVRFEKPYPDGSTHRCIIRTRTYAKTLKHLNHLESIARADFPGLDFDNGVTTDVIVYGGDTVKRTMGIEFNINQAPPPEYTQINQVELSLN